MKFSKKKVGEFPTYKGFGDLVNYKSTIKATVIVCGIVLILFMAKWVLGMASGALSSVSYATAKLVGEQVGEPMELDEFGNINVLIAGYGGENHDGGYLTDSMMIASFNPKLGTVTFLSVPRDLYVKINTGYYSRINGMYRSWYLQGKDSPTREEDAIFKLADKMTEISGLEIPYYMMIDFQGLVKLVDAVGGVEVEVKDTIHDTEYPGPNHSYTIFHLDQGKQLIDGETALKYARSRHSTSDFSRSYRQQQIIEGVMHKMLGSISLTQLGKVRDTYSLFTSMIETNIGVKQVLGLVGYLNKPIRFFSFVYSADCSTTVFAYATPGCVLYNANRDDFGGAATLLPQGANVSNISYYKHTQDFAFWVAHNQEFLLEAAPVRILNGIDADRAKKEGYNVNGVAGEAATNLKLKGFLIDDIKNASGFFDQTTVIVSETGAYAHTVELLHAFIDIPLEHVSPLYGSGVTIVLGQDYLEKL